MSSFSDRLRSEIDYAGLTQKEFAARTGIKKRALEGYLGVQQSIPPADVAVRMAKLLGLSVEYLVNGEQHQNAVNISRYLEFRPLLDDLAALPEDLLHMVKTLIRVFAEEARKNHTSGPATGQGPQAGSAPANRKPGRRA
ncbi:MAG: helix-turn-helix domain-containing protein [Spirochaetaceae bacterium]|jgi:transcriptional regulator with XRE-family HTH domain|nr:helix-turn-helix domain-containing protein [Spirochaetaceae bacterium]